MSAAEFGVRGGVNFSSIPSHQKILIGSNGFANHYIEALTDSYVGFHFGVFTRFSIGDLFIQPELLYTESGQEMLFTTELIDEAPTELKPFSPIYSHLTIPVTVGLYFGPLRVGAGPDFNILLGSTREHLDYLQNGDNISFNYRDALVGYQVLAGLSLGNLTLDFKYKGSLSNFGDQIRIGDESFEFHTRPRQFVISLGIIMF